MAVWLFIWFPEMEFSYINAQQLYFYGMSNIQNKIVANL